MISNMGRIDSTIYTSTDNVLGIDSMYQSQYNSMEVKKQENSKPVHKSCPRKGLDLNNIRSRGTNRNRLVTINIIGNTSNNETKPKKQKKYICIGMVLVLICLSVVITVVFL